MSNKKIKLDLSSLAGGGLQEKVDKELAAVIENLLDLNTDAKAKRKVAITLTMSANDDRSIVETAIDIKSTLAPQKGVATTVLIGRDIDTGEVHANELKSGVLGQTYFDDNGDMRTDTGELIEEIEKKSTPEIIDFNQKKVGN